MRRLLGIQQPVKFFDLGLAGGRDQYRAERAQLYLAHIVQCLSRAIHNVHSLSNHGEPKSHSLQIETTNRTSINADGFIQPAPTSNIWTSSQAGQPDALLFPGAVRVIRKSRV